jgi:hypothetical protein
MRYQRQQLRQQELTLGNALTDPLVRTVMAADGVDPEDLRAMLSEIVSTLDHAQLQPQRSRSPRVTTNCC